MYNKHVNVYTHTYTQFLYMEQASVGGVGTNSVVIRKNVPRYV